MDIFFNRRHPSSPRHPSRGGPWIAWLVAGMLAMTPCYGADIPYPDPAAGTYAPTALALLGYNKTICDGIAGDVLSYWRSLGASQADELGKVQNRLLQEDSLSDLAAGRFASDIIRSLLPRARRETDSETGAALERLYELETQLCDTVAFPNVPIDTFADTVQQLLDQIEREEEELGRLLVVPDTQLQSFLEPFLQPIQLAGFEAQNEYLDYLEGLKPKPKKITVQELMVQWHGNYSKAVEPTKLALGRYIKARQENDFRGMSTACREILAEVIPLLRRREVFSPPKQQIPLDRGIQPEFYSPLFEAYNSMRDMATHCAAGRSREVIESLTEMQEKLQVSATYLSKYSVRP